MDRSIVSFTSRDDAKKFADALHSDHVTIAANKGYTVINNEIVGKVNGVDNPTAQRTTAWTSITDEIDRTFSILDESANDLFNSRLTKQAGGYTKKTAPPIAESDFRV